MFGLGGFMAFEWRFAHIDGHCGNHSLSVVKDILCDINYRRKRRLLMRLKKLKN